MCDPGPARRPARRTSRSRLTDWWHTIELGPGEVTPGGWDLRPTARRMPWPARGLRGLRCLDVGTMDGFWAFEMERRGAGEVVALDRMDPARPTFRLAAERLGSRVVYRSGAVHDLDPDAIGRFDLIFAGYLLQMVDDPLGAVAAMRRVCRGALIVLDTVSLPLTLLPAPLARLNARRGYTERFVFNRSGLAQAVRLGGFRIETMTPLLRDHPGPAVERSGLAASLRLRHAVGVLGRSAAVRGVPTNL